MTNWAVSHMGPPVMAGIKLSEAQKAHIKEVSGERDFFEYFNPHREPVINGGRWVYEDYDECMRMCKAIEENNREHRLRELFSNYAPGTFKPMRYS